MFCNPKPRRRVSAVALVLLIVTNADAAEFGVEASASVGSESTQNIQSTLESSGAVVGQISIVNDNIFDLDNPKENKALFRFANRVHFTTRATVIEQQLLFSPGEKYSTQKLEESERIIRGNRYIQDVSVRPIAYNDGVVDVAVTSRDVWTLMPRLSFSRSGGKNKSTVGIKDANLFGTGMAVELAVRSNVDRDSSSIKFVDRNLGSSWFTLEAYYANNSDGFSRYLSLEEPFYSLNSRLSRGVSTLRDDSVKAYYDSGERLSEYRHQTKQSKIFVGWSGGLRDGFSKRIAVGLAIDENIFSSLASSTLPEGPVPAGRKLVYPFVAFERLEDDFEKTNNHNQIGRTEDRFLGTRIYASLGIATKSAGSDRNAFILDASAQTGFGSSADRLLLLAANVGARLEGSGVRNLLVGSSAQYFKRQSEKRLLYVSFNASYGRNLDGDQFLELGGDSGLRGYPLRYQLGDKRALLTIEQRYFTDWYPWRLFRVGGAVFFDIGQAWGSSPLSVAKSELLRDIGFGLRIGNDRSGLGRTTHIDIAMPLDGDRNMNDIQFLISTKKSF